MGWVSALIGGAASLIGGRADRKQRDKELAMQDPVYRRERLEAAGLNPDVHFGSTSGLGRMGYGPVMGRAIADAGAMLANGLDTARQHKLEVTRLEMEKRKLDAALKQQTIRPRVGGYYEQRRNNAAQRGPSDGSSRRLSTGVEPPVREFVHKYIDVWDSDFDRVISILNPELTESGPGEMATGVATLGGALATQHGIPALMVEKPTRKKQPLQNGGVSAAPIPPVAPFPREPKKFDADLQKEKDRLSAEEWLKHVQRRERKPRRIGPY